MSQCYFHALFRTFRFSQLRLLTYVILIRNFGSKHHRSKTLFSQDELNRAYEQEIAAKDDLAKQMKELKKDYDFTRDQYESEVNAKSEMQKALSKSNTELNEWRQKYEEEAVVKNGQLEETNKGLVSELNTLGDEMLAAKSKVSLPRDLGTIRSTWNI